MGQAHADRGVAGGDRGVDAVRQMGQAPADRGVAGGDRGVAAVRQMVQAPADEEGETEEDRCYILLQTETHYLIKPGLFSFRLISLSDDYNVAFRFLLADLNPG
jgi:hypothetical protein